jgi:hypothetical protein
LCQSFNHLSFFLVFLTLTHSAERSVFDDCFNLGFQDGESAGCNAASGNSKREYDDLFSLLIPVINGRLDIVREARQLQCTGSLANAFNEGFNSGFNDGFNRCS